MTTTEVMKLALDALKKAKQHIWVGDEKGIAANIQCTQTITVVEKALAQPEQKSGIKQVIELYDSPDQPSQQEPGRNHYEDGDVFERIAAMKKQPAPVAKPHEQEPVACVIDGDLYFHHEIDWEDLAYQGHGVELLYTSPPTLSLAQRQTRSADTWVNATTWRGLTDEEIAQGCKESWVTEQAWQSAVWWAEAKLKEKNCG